MPSRWEPLLGALAARLEFTSELHPAAASARISEGRHCRLVMFREPPSRSTGIRRSSLVEPGGFDYFAAAPTIVLNWQGLLAGVCLVVPPASAIASSKLAAPSEPGNPMTQVSTPNCSSQFAANTGST
jgi:hypothetical protein